MRIWKVLFTVLTIISASLGLMNIISYDYFLLGTL